jgi:hypothetical protein
LRERDETEENRQVVKENPLRSELRLPVSNLENAIQTTC